MIYLNNAAGSYPKPASVLDAVNDAIARPPVELARGGGSSHSPVSLGECRDSVASFFGIADPRNLVFTYGATHSLNLVINGLELAGAHVVLSNLEHNSVIRPLKALERDNGVELSVVECDKSSVIAVDAVAAAIKPETKAIFLNQCSNVTGILQPVAQVCRFARERGIVTVIDASQSAGIVPIDVSDIGADVLVFTGHKALFGLPGVGGAYISPDLSLKPLMSGGTGVRSDYLYQPVERPLLYEAGTPNIPGIVSLYAGISFIEQQGLSTIAAKLDSLYARLVDGLAGLEGVTLYGIARREDPSAKHAAIVSFNVRGLLPEDTAYMLENSFGIVCRSGLHCAPLVHRSLGSGPQGTVRLSLSYFNTESEIDCCIDAVKQISGASSSTHK